MATIFSSTSSAFSGLADLVINRTNLILKVSLILMVVSIIGMMSLSMATGNSTYQDEDSESSVISNHYSETFSQESIILLIECNDPTSPEVLKYIDSLKKPIKNLQYISSVSSIADLLKEANGGVLPLSSGEVITAKEKISPTVWNQFVPSHLMTMVMISLNPGLADVKKNSAIGDVKSFVSSTSIPPGVTVSVTGSAAFATEMGAAMGQSMMTLIMAALVLMVIVLGLLFSYVSHRFLPVAIVTVGLLFTFGIIGLAGIQISMAAISAFPVLIGLGIDYAIQFHARLEEEARTNPLTIAVRNTITRTGPAVMYAMLATAVGFYAMFISTVPMIRGFGLVSIIGVITCYVTSLIGIPAVALFLNYQAKGSGKSRQSEFIDSSLSRIAVTMAKNPVVVLLVVLFVAFVGIQLESQIQVNTNENSFVPSDMPAKVTMNKVSRTMGSSDSAAIYVAGSDVTSLESIIWMKEFTDLEMRSHSELKSAISIADYLISPDTGALPATQSELDAALRKISEDVRKQYVNGNNEAVIQLGMIKLESGPKKSLKKLIESDLQLLPPPPGITARLTGSFALFTDLIDNIVNSKDLMTYLGFILVVFFLALVYRNVYAITPIVPIVAIVGWNAVAMYMMGIEYNPMTACLGSMTIGVAAEYTILVMERYIEEREKTENVIEAIKNSVQKIGSAIMVSGFATFFGFSALTLSTFPIISNFGLTTIIAVLFSLIGAIAVMPAVLSLADQIVNGVKNIEKGIHESGEPVER
ncbi:MAG: hydrophobe/amphiphile efflux-3 (HAE3) family transporter [Methanobacteriota archaeon]